jgi:16S rRNA (adenine1518-N6/adenine1519-N6)-dimethyltransferase
MLSKHIINLANKQASKAKKSLGQNFLVDLAVYEQINSFIGDLAGKSVLEIGPGLGSLTHVILALNPHKLIAIEKDRNFIQLLEENFKNYADKFSIIETDALKVNVSDLFTSPCYIIANLPYNISTVLLCKWLENVADIEKMFLMFQKEVAERIIARPGSKKYGRLSIIVQLLCEVELLFDIYPESFNPPPKVMSSFVKICPRKTPLADVNIKYLEKITNILFAQRRKMLGGTLKRLFKEDTLDAITQKIDIKKRPEELLIEEFCFLANLLEENDK